MRIFFSSRLLCCSLLVSLLGTLPMDAEEEIPVKAPAGNETWTFTREDMQQLPNGKHVASVLEFYFQPAILANPDTGGFSRAENVQISMLGESYKWQRWYFGGANISHPGRPGEPLLYMPLSMLGSISADKYAASNVGKNGIHMAAVPLSESKSGAEISMPFEIGGPAFIPRKVADREPASDWGAPTSARGFAPGSLEANANYVIRSGDKAVANILADGWYARRNSNNLGNKENAGEFTVMGAFAPGWLSGDALHLTLQGRSRARLGSEYYFAENQTMASSQLSALAQYNFASEKAEGALAFGYSYRNLTQNGSNLTRSLTDALIQAPAIIPENTHTFFIDASGFQKLQKDWARIEYGVNSRFELERRSQTVAGNSLTETLYGSALAATSYEGPSVEYNGLVRWQPFVRAIRQNARSEISGSVNGHIDWGFTEDGSKLGFVHPAAALKGRSYLGSSAFYLGGGVLHDTLGFNLQEVAFLNRDGLSGTRYNWADANGNGVAESGELTSPTRTGGKYHTVQNALQAPQKEELNLSLGYEGFRHWRLEFNMNGRIYRKLFEVRYADGTSPTFASSSAGGNVAVYDRTQAGSEMFELRNAEKDAYYAHVEITVARSRQDSDWIFRASIGGYYGAGYSPQGLGAFYNDVGAYGESTADPNFRENRFGRLDNDRGYIGKIFFGRRIAKVLTVTNVIRYRDGEATAGYKVVTGLAQGPITVPYEERGGGLTGIGRYTYSLAWDLRLRYETVFGGHAAWAFIDIYNLLNSRTELFEYPLTGTAFRDPVEQGTARTLRLGLGMNF